MQAWIPADGYYDLGAGPRQSPEQQLRAYPLSECMSCGCCLEACPQYGKVEVHPTPGESDEHLAARRDATYDVEFIGAHAINQAVYYNSHPTGQMQKAARIEALMEPGGIQVCGNAQNCVAVCPKSIPLTTSIAKAGRDATVQIFRRFLDR